jgi:predicted  nucleic acid-binding Zn-ribbon protein
LEGELRNYENKVAALTTEIERLNSVLKTRLGEIDDLRNKISKHEITIKNYTVVESENRGLQDKLQSNARTIEDFRHKVTKYETDINNLRLLERKHEESEKKNAMLNGELERLNGLLRGKVQ